MSISIVLYTGIAVLGIAYLTVVGKNAWRIKRIQIQVHNTVLSNVETNTENSSTTFLNE